MRQHRHSALLIAALAAAFAGAAFAQTQSDDTSRMPARKGMSQESQTQPSTDQTDKMKQGQGSQTDQKKQAMTSEQKSKETPSKTGEKGGSEKQAMASEHKAHHAKSAKSTRKTEEAASPDEKAYREALRDCVKEPNQGLRDSCLDNAIDKFHHNA